LLAVIPAFILLAPVGYSVVSSVVGQRGEDLAPFLEMPEPKYENCVKETEYMRFHHWELLRGVREEVVRYGKRGEIGLKKCSECHTSRERFCDRCHEAVSLKPDCFGCHHYP
jgi:hypothetical protein